MSASSDQSTAQVQKLIQQLYLPGNKPDEIQALQVQLQSIQGSSNWELADELLQSSDQNVRFFAALTFTVKINQSGSSLEEDDLAVLLEKLLSWLIRLVAQDESLLVLRKFCSTLVAYFMLPNVTWTKCIRHALCCLQSRSAINEASINNFPSTAELLTLIDSKTKSVILMLSTILAEDAIRIDHSSQTVDYCHRRVEKNIEDAVTVMRHEFDLVLLSSDDGNNDKHSELLDCYLSWMNYAGEEFLDSSDASVHLRKLLLPAIKCLASEQTFDSTAQFLIDLFTGSIRLDQDCIDYLYQFLTSSWALEHYSQIGNLDVDGDSILLVQLISAFGQVVARNLIESNLQYQPLMDILHSLTAAQSFESIDQSISNAMVDFWEVYSPLATMNNVENSFEIVKRNWLQAIQELVSAAALPINSDGELYKGGSDEVFAEFRSRVVHAIQGSYLEFDVSILEKLVSMVLELDDPVTSSLTILGRLEFTLYCISGLSDSMEHQSGLRTTEDDLLNNLFQSQTYANLMNFSIPCPEKLRKRAISLIGDQEIFFSNRPVELLAAFDILFKALEYPELHHTSARAIYLLAEKNRKLLTPKIEQFLLATDQLLSLSIVDSSAKEYIVGSVAAIAQAIEDDNARYAALMRICSCIQKITDTSLESAVEAMVYLKSLGKAFRAPDNQLINLEEDDNDQKTPAGLAEIQSRLVQFINLILEPYRQDGPLLVLACDVFRSGYRELQPGPFTFGPEVTADFVTAVSLSNTYLDTVILTAASFLNSHLSKQDDSLLSVLRLLQFVCDVIKALESPDLDPDLSYACIEFLSCIVQGHLDRLKHAPADYVSGLLSFSVQCLEGTNVPPKKSAAQLWRVIFDTFNQASEYLGGLISVVGPSLTNAFVHGFGGNATRSELPWLTEPFRKMVFTQPLARSWIEAALFSPAFPSSRPTDADKRRFLAQIAQLRGGRKTENVVKDFWLACRGAPAGYHWSKAR